jgi:hypothetical protein
MTNSNGPRQFWLAEFDATGRWHLNDKPLNKDSSYYSDAWGEVFPDRVSHLIEYSAVESLQAELAEAKGHAQRLGLEARTSSEIITNIKQKFAELEAKSENLAKALQKVSDQLEDALRLDEKLADGWQEIKSVSNMARKAALEFSNE